MRCTHLIVVTEGKARGSGKPVEKIVATDVTWFGIRQGMNAPPEAVECGGTIDVSVVVQTSDGCGCCGSSDAEVVYRCSRCKGTFYPELPGDADELGKFLTKMLAEMPDAEHQKLIEARWDWEQVKQEQLNAFRGEMAKKRKK